MTHPPPPNCPSGTDHEAWHAGWAACEKHLYQLVVNETQRFQYDAEAYVRAIQTSKEMAAQFKQAVRQAMRGSK